MKFDVIITDIANEELLSIINYITEDSKSIDRALNYLNVLESAIMNLSEFPYKGVEPRYKSIKIQGYRVLIVESHLVFYKVSEERKEVIIYRILHGKQEYRNLI